MSVETEQYMAGYKAGKRDARQDLQLLVQAVEDTIFMFSDIEKARQLPPFAQAWQQYVAMGRVLRCALAQSGLKQEEDGQ